MIKHVVKDLSVVFNEVPDEITLAFNISNCQNNCVGCHSKYLTQDIGEELTADVLENYLVKNTGISCVCFMGEGNDQEALINLVNYIRTKHPNLKIALYSGRDNVESELMELFDYVKIGPYKEEFGPLNKQTTNQRLYKKFGDAFADITYRFWGESFKEHEVAKYVLSDDKEQVERIEKALIKKKEKYGLGYCPCVSPRAHSKDTVCSCLNYRMTGKCHCKLYKE